MTDRLEAVVEDLARLLADSRTHGNVYMDGSHNPLPSEYAIARQFLADWGFTTKESRD